MDTHTVYSDSREDQRALPKSDKSIVWPDCLRVATNCSAAFAGGFSHVTGLCARTPDRTTSSRGSVWNRPQRQIFGPHSGASRSLLYARSLPLSFSYFPCFLIFSILLSLPFSYCRCVLLTIRLILVRLTYCTRLLFFHHALLTTIANATHSNMFTVSTITILETK